MSKINHNRPELVAKDNFKKTIFSTSIASGSNLKADGKDYSSLPEWHPLVNVAPKIVSKQLSSYAFIWNRTQNKNLKLVVTNNFPEAAKNLDELNKKINELEPTFFPIVRHLLLNTLTNSDGTNEISCRTTVSINNWINHFVRYIKLKKGIIVTEEALGYLFERLSERMIDGVRSKHQKFD